jgi:hypothetical protein
MQTGKDLDIDPVAQEASRSEHAEKAKQRASRAAADLSWLMSSPRGRRFAFSRLEYAGAWRSSFDRNALQMAFNEGQRNEALRLIADIQEACPEQWQVMLNEQKGSTNE